MKHVHVIAVDAQQLDAFLVSRRWHIRHVFHAVRVEPLVDFRRFNACGE
jgi:hypothetical protein